MTEMHNTDRALEPKQEATIRIERRVEEGQIVPELADARVHCRRRTAGGSNLGTNIVRARVSRRVRDEPAGS